MGVDHVQGVVRKCCQHHKMLLHVSPLAIEPFAALRAAHYLKLFLYLLPYILSYASLCVCVFVWSQFKQWLVTINIFPQKHLLTVQSYTHN